jgi:hypothetical protein
MKMMISAEGHFAALYGVWAISTEFIAFGGKENEDLNLKIRFSRDRKGD